MNFIGVIRGKYMKIKPWITQISLRPRSCGATSRHVSTDIKRGEAKFQRDKETKEDYEDE